MHRRFIEGENWAQAGKLIAGKPRSNRQRIARSATSRTVVCVWLAQERISGRIAGMGWVYDSPGTARGRRYYFTLFSRSPPRPTPRPPYI